MKSRLRIVFAAALLAACMSGRAQDDSESAVATTLHVGDPAPALAPGKWLKGEPVTAFAPGKVYVVEFWATWCGPCRTSIPHLSDLQARFKDRGVIIIGQNCSETDVGKVQAFVDKMGDKMNYRVAMDDTSKEESGRMNATWMDAAGQQGIPTAFVVDDQGRIAWIGHPMNGLDAVLEQVLAGTFDAAKTAEQTLARAKAQEALYKALSAGKLDEALTLADEWVAVEPDAAQHVAVLKFQILFEQKDYAKAYEFGEQALEALKGDADGLNQIAWVIATSEGIEQRELALAEKAAVQANELSERKDGAILDTLARVYFEQGKIDEAIATQTEALAQANEEDKAQIEEALKTYQAARETPAAVPAP